MTGKATWDELLVALAAKGDRLARERS